MTGKSGFIGGPTDPFETPDAPAITGVSAGVLTADVTFTAPADTGGAAISSYVITAKQGDGTSVAQTASAAGTTTLTLTAGGTTTFGAQAFNLYGAGQFSGLGNSTSVFTGQELYAWGDNGYGQLGLNISTTEDRSSPVQVGTESWSQVSDGIFSTFAVKTDGTLWGWGSNTWGQLGQNNIVSQSSPVQIGALTNWSQVSFTYASVGAIKTDGTMWTWGQSNYGHIAHNDDVDRSSPVQVGALTTWSQIGMGNGILHAIKTDGTLWGCGRASYGGAVGDNTEINRSSPVQIGALTTWSQVENSTLTAIAVKTDGTLWGWGSNGARLVGDNTNINRSSPVQIGALTTWSQVSGGFDMRAAIKTDNTLWVWGNNSNGELGLNDTINRSSPTQVGSTDWASASAGMGNTVNSGNMGAIKTDGTLWVWGSNSSGELGLNDLVDRSSPVQVGSSTNWFQVSVGRNNTFAIERTTS